MNNAGTLICKKRFVVNKNNSFLKNKKYNYSIFNEHSKEEYKIFINDLPYIFSINETYSVYDNHLSPYLWKYFYSESELRKLKLKKLKNV